MDILTQTRPLRVLIGCEFTGTVRREFDKLGHDVWSCDLRRALDNSNRHIVGDVRDVLGDGWDLLIVAHPPCTRLCNSGVRWLNDPTRMDNPGEDFTPAERAAWPSMGEADRRALMQRKLEEGAALFSDCWNAPVPRVAVENPKMHKYGKALIRNFEPAAQYVQPWQFGEWETKATGLWLRGLPNLQGRFDTLDAARAGLGKPADAKPIARVHNTSPGADRGKERSAFFPSIARAMAEQWGGYALEAMAA